ncbi:unnamed protein product [Lampetra planeri]
MAGVPRGRRGAEEGASHELSGGWGWAGEGRRGREGEEVWSGLMRNPAADGAADLRSCLGFLMRAERMPPGKAVRVGGASQRAGGRSVDAWMMNAAVV